MVVALGAAGTTAADVVVAIGFVFVFFAFREMLLFVGTPPALGSWWGLLPAAAIVVALGARAVDEERFLPVHLPGYDRYCAAVRSRLVPGVW